MKKSKTIAVQINKDLPGFKKGVVTTVTVDGKGTPLEKFWRDRFHDAKTDNCVEIKTEKKVSKQEPKS